MYSLRLTWFEFKIALSQQFSFRWRVFIWVLTDTFQPVLFAVLWGAVARNSETALSSGEMVSYFFLVAIITRVTQDWSFQSVSNSIIDGTFSNYLLKPYNYLVEVAGVSLASKFLRMIFVVPFLVGGWLLFKEYLNYDLEFINLILFTVSLLIGIILNFLLGNILALSAFFVKQVLGLRAFYQNFLSLASGEYAPYAVLPIAVAFGLNFFPFRYIVSFPAEILMGNLDSTQKFVGLLLSLAWVIVLVFIFVFIFKFAIKKYESEGI